MAAKLDEIDAAGKEANMAENVRSDAVEEVVKTNY